MKMMYASDYPLLTFDRVRRELARLWHRRRGHAVVHRQERGEGLLGRGDGDADLGGVSR